LTPPVGCPYLTRATLSIRAEKARAWFFKWRDKSFSFTDCTSFSIMRELNIKKVLTGDRHFREAGFEILP